MSTSSLIFGRHRSKTTSQDVGCSLSKRTRMANFKSVKPAGFCAVFRTGRRTMSKRTLLLQLVLDYALLARPSL
eukprot:1100237-Amphidinium_carterae.1